ncbi:MAG: hypothetical protein ACOZAA_04435, partial [Pseudomonadota bacterium]
MKSNVPWSVKGIERDARETAKAAAQREGVTVGEWLNQIIYTAGDPNAAPTEGEIEGLRTRDLAAAIEYLSRRIASAEANSADAVETLARSFGGAVERLQRLERMEPGEAGGDVALAERVKALEEKSADRQRIDALRALERAVGQIAVQFSNAQTSTVLRLDATERQLQTLASRIESGGQAETVSAGAVREAIEGMAARIARAEKIAAEAAQLKAEAGESVDADFIHKTGIRLRILGDEIKRGGDQIKTLESTIARLSQQIDAAEKRSAEGVQKVAETIADLRSQFSSADANDQAAARAEIEAAVSEIAQRTEDRIETLQQSFDAMVRKLESAGGRSGQATAEQRPAPLAAAPTPRVESDPFDDLDSELDDAFAALELEEPVPTPAPRPDEAQIERDADDFAFDAEDADGAEKPEEAVDAETADVLAEIREAFGLSEASPGKHLEEESEEPPPVEAEIDLDDAMAETSEPPPIAAEPVADEEAKQADYLKAARRAAREAAAKAAAEQHARPKKKLTPKQRAILAARIKRRKQEEAGARDASEELVATPAVEKQAGGTASVKARVMALVAKIKSRPAAKSAEPSLDAPADNAQPAAASPSFIGGATAALQKLKTIP